MDFAVKQITKHAVRPPVKNYVNAAFDLVVQFDGETPKKRKINTSMRMFLIALQNCKIQLDDSIPSHVCIQAPVDKFDLLGFVVGNRARVTVSEETLFIEFSA